MNELVLSTAFKRAFKRLHHKNPNLAERVNATMKQLQIDPHSPNLHTHKLTGECGGQWSCSAGYDLRILFRIKSGQPNEIWLLALGTHDEVY
jgi:addiction module RelE/StbE family toxin